MSISSALTHRAHQWCETLVKHGYLISALTVDVSGGSLHIRARRSSLYGGPRTTIDVSEVWAPGMDPCAVMPALDNCYLHRCSWHAQIDGPGAVNAERLDVERSKPAPLVRHRHPHGQLNAVRQATTMSTPGVWLAHVDTIVSTLYVPPDEQPHN
jgi:hypothetical protein